MPLTQRFQSKLWDVVNFCKTGAVCWNKVGNGVIFNFEQFKKEYLDCEFFCKSNKIASFVRQLNLYGFKKVSHSSKRSRKKDLHEFANPCFAREREDLLRHMSRNTTYPKAKSKSTTKKRKRGRYKKVEFVDTVMHKPNKRGRPRKREKDLNTNIKFEENDHQYEMKKVINWNSQVEENETKPLRELCQDPEHLTVVKKIIPQEKSTTFENAPVFETQSQIIKNRLKVHKESDHEAYMQKEENIPKFSEHNFFKSINTKTDNSKCADSIQVTQCNFQEMQQKVIGMDPSTLIKGYNYKISDKNELTTIESTTPILQYKASKYNSLLKINNDPFKKTMQATVQEENCVALKIQDLANNPTGKQLCTISYQTKNRAKKPNFKENYIIKRVKNPQQLTENGGSIELLESSANNFKTFESMVKEPVGYKALFDYHKTDCEISDEYLALRDAYLRQTEAQSFLGSCICLKSYQSYEHQFP